MSGISGAFFALDIGLARDIVVERRAIERGHVHPKRGKGLGLAGDHLAGMAAAVAVPAALARAGRDDRCSVRRRRAGHEHAHSGLRGTRPLRCNDPAARRAPGADAYRWVGPLPALLAGPHQAGIDRRTCDLGGRLGRGDDPGLSRLRRRGSSSVRCPKHPSIAIATAAAGLLAAVRWTQAKGVDFGAPMVASQAGAFPPGLVTNLFRGFDVCLLTTAPLLLGFSPFWSLLIAAIAAMILLNSMDAETLRARQAEQQKQLAAQKKQRAEAAAAAKQRKR